MATAFDLFDEVLHAFDNSHRNEMTFIELHNILINRNIDITTDELIRVIRSPSLLNLFNLQSISNDLYLIQLKPKLTLCEACLQKGCKNKMKCTKLHLCRYISHFSNKPLEKPCYYPHKLSDHMNNNILLRRFNYDILNEDLLLNLLRHYYKMNHEQSRIENHINSNRSLSSQSSRINSNNIQGKQRILQSVQSRPLSQLNKSSILIDKAIERQLDISIPSEQDAPDIDLEIIELILATKHIIIERTLEKQVSNEFYRRYTLQFKNKQVIDNILQNEPIIMYNNIPIKMKRTIRQQDKKIFALKFKTNQKIDSIRLNLYVETLVGKVHPNIFDMTNDDNDEQIYLIRCEQPIDFEHLYKVHSAKNTLQGYRITIIKVYETESLEVSFVNDSYHKSMSISRLRQLIGEHRWQQDVFACLCIRNQTSAEIELINAEVTAKWLSEANRIEEDMSLAIHPIIDFIQSSEKNEDDGDDEEIIKLFTTSNISSPLSVSNDSQKSENESGLYTIKPDWRIVLTHPVFGDEYRKYIRENLNISANITGSSIQVPNEYIRKELARYTNMFIQKFIFQELSNLDKIQVKIIKTNYSRMAHKWQKDTNTTLIAARRDIMNELFPSLSSSSRQQNKLISTPTFSNKQSPTSRKQEQQLISPIKETLISQTKSSEDYSQILSYPIENSVYFPFFTSSNPFSDRLTTYLLNTFNVKLDIKSISSVKIILELKGQHKDISDARPSLTNLFASLKTKIYSDKNDSCKFSIPDIYRVVQCKFDQCSIISSCSYSTKNNGSLLIRYFANNPQFGIDEQEIDDIIQNNLFNISYHVLITSKKLEINFEELQKKIQQRSDYGQDICCLYNYRKGSTERICLPSIHLCGTESIVRQIYQEIKRIADEYTPTLCNIQLTSNQVNFLLHICSADLIKFEKEYETDNIDLRSTLKIDTTSQFLAPKYLHEKIKLFLFEMSQIQMLSKDIKCSTQLINNKKQEFIDLALKNHCLLSITPTSSSLSQSTTSNRIIPNTTKISSGTINVSYGDLTTEQSEVLVICSSSDKLYDSVIKAAGKQIEQELNEKDPKKNMIDTSVGNLKQAKRLLFLPWKPPSTLITNQNIDALCQSILIFIQQAIQYTIQEKFKSIAFPAIGCGGYGIPADIIATIMIDSVRQQLNANPATQLVITFVVQQSNVFDVFNAKLQDTSTITTNNRTRSSSLSYLSNQEKFNISLITSNFNIDIAKKLLANIENILASSVST
ncbi:unnamed protein product [Rotaria sordida]|uniref:Macro domain-containing protein n=1 Tax=Rotaria sordida TaxID=392033 RepID=A0A814QKF0_9BILA|nr:unnamed protein product [Rotaria sordida]